jgi:hypothetical protein
MTERYGGEERADALPSGEAIEAAHGAVAFTIDMPHRREALTI